MKVLIISHNPVSTQSNMGKTFLSLFSQFGREELCQLYIYPVIPNADRCGSFYRVTDKDALNSLIRLKKAGGEIPQEKISADQGLYEVAGDQSFYKSRKNKSPIRRLLRDCMWQMAPWYNRGLKAWLDREQPDCIFVAPGVAKFLYVFAIRIANKRQIPIVTYICDEYYFVQEPDRGLDKIRLKLLRGKMEQLMAHTARLVVISEELRQEYESRFGVETTTLMTGAAMPAAESPRQCREPRNLCYFGNIRCNRYIPLGEIGRTLDEINRVQGTDYRLKIYSAEKDPAILQTFREISSVELCGFVSGTEFDEAFRSADLLLHTEAFDEASVDFTQHSVSTKIADSLASGIPLVAYGPEKISSMQHLLRHRCAIAAVSPEELRGTLETAFRNEAVRVQAAENALAVARKYHDSVKSGRDLRQILEDAAHKGN